MQHKVENIDIEDGFYKLRPFSMTTATSSERPSSHTNCSASSKTGKEQQGFVRGESCRGCAQHRTGTIKKGESSESIDIDSFKRHNKISSSVNTIETADITSSDTSMNLDLTIKSESCGSNNSDSGDSDADEISLGSRTDEKKGKQNKMNPIGKANNGDQGQETKLSNTAPAAAATTNAISGFSGLDENLLALTSLPRQHRKPSIGACTTGTNATYDLIDPHMSTGRLTWFHDAMSVGSLEEESTSHRTGTNNSGRHSSSSSRRKAKNRRNMRVDELEHQLSVALAEVAHYKSELTTAHRVQDGLEKQCKTLSKQNKIVMDDIHDVVEQYKELELEVEDSRTEIKRLNKKLDQMTQERNDAILAAAAATKVPNLSKKQQHIAVGSPPSSLSSSNIGLEKKVSSRRERVRNIMSGQASSEGEPSSSSHVLRIGSFEPAVTQEITTLRDAPLSTARRCKSAGSGGIGFVINNSRSSKATARMFRPFSRSAGRRSSHPRKDSITDTFDDADLKKSSDLSQEDVLSDNKEKQHRHQRSKSMPTKPGSSHSVSAEETDAMRNAINLRGNSSPTSTASIHRSTQLASRRETAPKTPITKNDNNNGRTVTFVEDLNLEMNDDENFERAAPSFPSLLSENDRKDSLPRILNDEQVQKYFMSEDIDFNSSLQLGNNESSISSNTTPKFGVSNSASPYKGTSLPEDAAATSLLAYFNNNSSIRNIMLANGGTITRKNDPVDLNESFASVETGISGLTMSSAAAESARSKGSNRSRCGSIDSAAADNAMKQGAISSVSKRGTSTTVTSPIASSVETENTDDENTKELPDPALSGDGFVGDYNNTKLGSSDASVGANTVHTAPTVVVPSSRQDVTGRRRWRPRHRGGTAISPDAIVALEGEEAFLREQCAKLTVSIPTFSFRRNHNTSMLDTSEHTNNNDGPSSPSGTASVYSTNTASAKSSSSAPAITSSAASACRSVCSTQTAQQGLASYYQFSLPISAHVIPNNVRRSKWGSRIFGQPPYHLMPSNTVSNTASTNSRVAVGSNTVRSSDSQSVNQ